MFVQISNSRLKKKKASSETSDTEDSSIKNEEDEKRSDDGKEGFAEVDLGRKVEHKEDKEIKDNILGRLGDRAAKLKRGSLGRLFGEKEHHVNIYTIDQEMKKARLENTEMTESKVDTRAYSSYLSSDGRQPKFINTELTNKLQKTRQPLPYDVGPRMKQTSIQASPYPPYRFYFIPYPMWNDPDDKTSTFLRLALSQISLLLFLVIWVIFGALTFYLTEGYLESSQKEILVKEEKSLSVSLATDLRLITSNNTSWLPKIEKYFLQHKYLVENFTEEGYSSKGFIWTYPGSFLFTISLITTLGYGFPLPSTVGGCVGAVFFALIGLPVNFLLLRSIGLSLATKIQLFAKEIDMKLQALKRRIQNVRKYGEARDEGPEWPQGLFEGEFRPPVWLPFLVPAYLLVFYLLGAVLFGPCRGRTSAYQILLFPCDLASGLAETEGFTRLAYALYIEVTAVLISLSVALFRVPAPCSVIDPLIHMNIVTNSLY